MERLSRRSDLKITHASKINMRRGQKKKVTFRSDLVRERNFLTSIKLYLITKQITDST